MDFVLGGYDAKSCPEKTRKEHDPKYAAVKRDPIPPGDCARMQAGVIFEDELGSRWAQELGPAFYAVPQCDRSAESKTAREVLTMQLLADPGDVHVVWNARLPQQFDTHRTGEPDALIRYGTVDNVVRWLPVDAKDHAVLEGSRKSPAQLVSPLLSPHPNDAQHVNLGAGVPRKSDALQLAHYQRMLEFLGHHAVGNLGGIIGRSDGILWVSLDEAVYKHPELGYVDALSYYDHEFNRRVRIAEAAIQGAALTGPEWKSECHSCPWRTTCHDELAIDLDHITLLPGITPPRAQAHYAQGVRSRAQLARLQHRTAVLVDAGIDVESLIDWADDVAPDAAVIGDWEMVRAAGKVDALAETQTAVAADVAQLHRPTAAYSGTKPHQLARSIDQARVTVTGTAHRARGVESVEIRRSSYEQDFDIEDAHGFVYLIGVRTSGRKRVGEDIKTRSEYREFVTWGTTAEDEANVFAAFWDYITGSQAYARSNRYGYRAYHFGHHEPSTFRSLAERHAGHPGVPTVDQVAAFFASKNVIDMHTVLSRQLIWPTESMSLKDIAAFVQFRWRDDTPGGDNSMAWYESAINDPDAQVRAENRQRLIEYNADDCAAQVAIRDFLSRLGEARQPGRSLPNVCELEARFEPRP